MAIQRQEEAATSTIAEALQPSSSGRSSPDGYDEDCARRLSVHAVDDCSRFRVLGVYARRNANVTVQLLDRLV
jgi:hypothetical protein